MPVEVTKNNVARIFKSMVELTKKGVYVGIPEDENARNVEGKPINNARLGYIHEFGSPIANIPARPFLIPGVTAIEKQAEVELGKSIQATIAGDTKLADQHLNRVGIIASNKVKEVINSNIPPPLKPRTVRDRWKVRGTKSRRANEILYMQLINQGMLPGTAQDEAGIIALVDTGQLRNSITYVIKN